MQGGRRVENVETLNVEAPSTCTLPFQHFTLGKGLGFTTAGFSPPGQDGRHTYEKKPITI